MKKRITTFIFSFMMFGNAQAANIFGTLFGGGQQNRQQAYNQQGVRVDFRNISFYGDQPMIGNQAVPVDFFYQNSNAFSDYMRMYPQNATRMVHWMESQANRPDYVGQQARAVLANSGFPVPNNNNYYQGNNTYQNNLPYQQVRQPTHNGDPRSINEMLLMKREIQ